MASPTRWTWVWASSRSWRWTGRPGVLQSMGWKELDMTEDWVTTAATKTGLLWEANPTDFVWTHLVALRRRLKCKEETHVDITQLLFKERVQCRHESQLSLTPNWFAHFSILFFYSLYIVNRIVSTSLIHIAVNPLTEFVFPKEFDFFTCISQHVGS